MMPAILYRFFAPLLALIVALALVYRVPIASGFDLGFGERGDGIIEIAILEHWRNVFSGVSPWHTTLYFHPYAGTLGYNDGYALYGLVYSFWRLFADPFHADGLNILTFKTVGFVGAYILVSRTLCWGRGAAVFVALLWTVASNVALQIYHAQLQSVALLPWAMILGIAIVRYEQAGRLLQARSAAVALALLMAAWLLTSYYMAWFTIFSACLFVLCWAVLTGHWRPTAWIRLVRSHAGTGAWGFGVFGIAIVPFLAIYLPKMRETGGESYHEMLGYLVTPLIDMVNVGADNYLWGWMFRPLLAALHRLLPDDPALPGRVLGGEHETGFPILMAILLLIALRRLIGRRTAANGCDVPVELRAFAIAMLIAWLLTLQFWEASPWTLVFELVPGAKGMRVVSRYQIWLTLPFLLLIVAAWRERAIILARSKPWLAGLIVTLLVVENLSAETSARLDRSDSKAALWRIPPPPPPCASFYVVATRPVEPLYINPELHALYPHNVDAMLLAELWRVPTLNGFSTFNPPDWNFGAPWAADYHVRVRRYARRHGLRNLCRLDVRQPDPWAMTTGTAAAP